MDSITDFVNDITAYEINIPLNLKIGFLVIVIIALCVGGYFLYDIFDVTALKNGFTWFIFIAVLNLVSILIIFLYYNKTQGTYKGPDGNTGKKGKIGKKGTSVSCSLCKKNIYLQKVRRSEVLCKLKTYVKEFQTTLDNEQYFNNIINKGNKINYDSFINSIILNIQDGTTNKTAINNFSTLMNINSISILLIKAINEITKASSSIYGTFRHPGGKVGYIPLGDSVYGGLENNIELNSFMIDGNILYPNNYKNLVSFKTYNELSNQTDTYTIWRPNGQIINEPGFKGAQEKLAYKALGDVCRSGTKQPNVNETPTVSEKCLEEVDIKDIHLVFIYVGNIQVKNEINDIDYAQTNSYLIANTPLNDIEIFSVWRTPLNTFITNCNSENIITNNTVIFNIINNLNGSLNKYGNVSSTEKNRINNLIESIQIPKILTALILCKYYEIELMQDLVYYINRYKHIVPEFHSVNTLSMTFADVMNLLSTVQKSYKDFNTELVKKANITLKGEKVIDYDETKEKHLPKILLNVYETTNTKLLTIPVQIENINNLLNILNLVFENGIETRVAIDSDGIAQGGVFMNSIQEMILRICKMLLPPNVPVYTIKDECLGSFALDREREEIIKKFTDARALLIKLIEEIESDKINTFAGLPNKYKDVIPSVNQYIMQFYSKQGQLCGHIDNFDTKILNGNFEEFTTSRIKGLIEIYNDTNNFLQNIIKTT